VSYVLHIVGICLTLDVDDGGGVDDRARQSGLVVVAAQHARHGAAYVAIGHVCHRMCHLRIHRDHVEEAVVLRLIDAELSPLAADAAGNEHGFEHRPLLIHEARIRREHGGNGLIRCMLALDMVLRQPML
jgi:hypothetical protein